MTTTLHTTVVPARVDELARLSLVLSAAFADNPVSDWLFDGEQDTHHPPFFLAFLRLGLTAGRVEQSADGTAVAVWIDRTSSNSNATAAAPRFGAEVRKAVGPHEGRWWALDEATSTAHPSQPHWWLAFLGVMPGHRHHGHAHRLLTHATHWLDDTPAYLEATSRRLCGFYARHGFHTTGGLIAMPERGAPVLHPMQRPPATDSTRPPRLDDPAPTAEPHTPNQLPSRVPRTRRPWDGGPHDDPTTTRTRLRHSRLALP